MFATDLPLSELNSLPSTLFDSEMLKLEMSFNALLVPTTRLVALKTIAILVMRYRCYNKES